MRRRRGSVSPIAAGPPSPAVAPLMAKSTSPVRCFDSSPGAIRLVVMMEEEDLLVGLFCEASSHGIWGNLEILVS